MLALISKPKLGFYVVECFTNKEDNFDFIVLVNSVHMSEICGELLPHVSYKGGIALQQSIVVWS